MATIAELNIRLGLLTKGFDRDMRSLERRLEQSAKKISDLGSKLSTSLTLPLVGLGYAAIKSAGDIEALKLALTSTMQGAGKSTADAAAELEALRKIALAPGIDFQQAVQGSIRLQSVGISAADAREQLVQLANAVAAAGGTAENLNSVTVQFAQMIAKGKVFTQDLKIIKENLPSIGGAMQRAFGTQSAEDLQALGISAKDFISAVTKELAKAPRVAGGIKNSLVNLFVGLQLEAARLGEEINKAFNIGAAGDMLLKAVKSIVDAFVSLSPASKKVVVGLAAIAAGTGPVLFVWGKLFSVFNTARTGFLVAAQAVNVLNSRVQLFAGVQSVLQSGVKAFTTTASAATNATQGLSLAFASSAKAAEANRSAGRLMAQSLKKAGDVSVATAQNFTGFSAVIQRATAAVAALNVAQKLLLFGGIAVVVAGVAIAFNELTKELTATEKAQKAVAEAVDLAARDVAVQKYEVQRLTGILENENSTLSAKERALKKLQEISPEYYGGLTIAKGKVEGLTTATDAYVKSLIRAATVERAKSQIADLILQQEDLRQSTYKTKSLFDKLASAGPLAAVSFNSKTKEFEAINAQINALTELISKTTAAQETAGELGKTETSTSEDVMAAAEKAKAAKEDAAKAAKLYKDALSSIAAVVQKGDVLGGDIIGEQAKEIENQIERLIENGFKPYGKEIMNLKAMLQGLQLNQQISFTAPDKLPGLNIPVSVSSTELPPLGTEGILKAKDAFSALGNTIDETVNGKIRAAYEAFNADTITSTELMQRLGDVSAEQSAQNEERVKIWAQAIEGLGSAIASSIESGAVSFKTFAKAAASSISVVIGELLKLFVANILAKTAIAGPIGVAIGGAVAAIGSALFKRVVGAQKFATGGVVRKPTLGLVGEYPGAATNPEIISPENKLRQIFRQEGSGGGELTAFVRGDDLLFILDKARARRGRRG